MVNKLNHRFNLLSFFTIKLINIIVAATRMCLNLKLRLTDQLSSAEVHILCIK